MKKVIKFLVAVLFLINIYGCFLIIAGAAGGVGTAVWLSGKLSQTVNARYGRTVEATRLALKSLDMPISKESKSEKVTQFRSDYVDGREVWIDVRPVTESSSKIEVRVGATGDKAASDRILKRIVTYL